jgi:hypothetical protein
MKKKSFLITIFWKNNSKNYQISYLVPVRSQKIKEGFTCFYFRISFVAKFDYIF